MKMRSEADEQAMERILAAKRGDERALEELILPSKPLLRSLAGRFHCSYVSAEELMQAGYVGLMRAIQHYDVDRGASLITYAVPWILGEIRSIIREACAQASVISLDHQTGEDDAKSLMDQIASGDFISMERLDLNIALRSLPKEEQMVICLRYFRDRTQKETAELLRRSQAQVSRIERRAIDRLRDQLA